MRGFKLLRKTKIYTFLISIVTILLLIFLLLSFNYKYIKSRDLEFSKQNHLKTVQTAQYTLDSIFQSATMILNTHDVISLTGEVLPTNFQSILGIRNLNILLTSSELIKSLEIQNSALKKSFSTAYGINQLDDEKSPHHLLHENAYFFTIHSNQHSKLQVYLDKKRFNTVFFSGQNLLSEKELKHHYNDVYHRFENSALEKLTALKFNDHFYISYLPIINHFYVEPIPPTSFTINKDFYYLLIISLIIVVFSFIGLNRINHFFLSRPLELIFKNFDVIQDEQIAYTENIERFVKKQLAQNEKLNKINKTQELSMILSQPNADKNHNYTYNIKWNKPLVIYLIIDFPEVLVDDINLEKNIEYLISHNNIYIVSNSKINFLEEKVILKNNYIFKVEIDKYKDIHKGYALLQKEKEKLVIYSRQNLITLSINDSMVNVDDIRQLEESLIDSIKVKNKEASLASLNKWFDYIKYLDYSSLIMEYQRMHSLLTHFYIQSDFNEANFLTNDIFSKFISNIINIEIINQYFLELVAQYFSLIDLYLENEESIFIDKIKEFIHMNLTDPSFSINDVAAHFDLSNHYINRRFKNNTSLSISNYINDCRLDSACDLLISSNLSIKDISTKIGIENTAYFSTLFKKKYNVTPSEYRNMK